MPSKYTHRVNVRRVKKSGALKGLEVDGSFRVCSEKSAKEDVARISKHADVVSVSFSKLEA